MDNVHKSIALIEELIANQWLAVAGLPDWQCSGHCSEDSGQSSEQWPLSREMIRILDKDQRTDSATVLIWLLHTLVLFFPLH